MPNKRATDQKLINIPMTKDAVAELDDYVAKAGYPDRAKFIRDAICEKLESLGYKVHREWYFARPRMGKGGRPTHRRKYPGPTAPFMMNEKGKSTKPADSKE